MNYHDNEVLLGAAKKEDMASVAEMIQELADFEKMSEGPKLTVQDLERDGFESQPPAFRCLVAEVQQQVLGYALYFPLYSTWCGRSLQLEDLYVRPAHRRRGLGGRLLDAVAEEAIRSGCSRLELNVLQWNEARSLYERKGAVNLTATEQWCHYRLDHEALRAAGSNCGAAVAGSERKGEVVPDVEGVGVRREGAVEL